MNTTNSTVYQKIALIGINALAATGDDDGLAVVARELMRRMGKGVSPAKLQVVEEG